MLRLFTQLILILFGLILAFALGFYALAEVPGHGLMPGNQTFFDALYFSVVTISSLGYGDLWPEGISRLIAGTEVLVGLGFIGYLVSRIVSLRQAELLERLQTSDIVGKFDECLFTLREAKEDLADLRRTVSSMDTADEGRFRLGQGNPFYGPKRALEGLLGYVEHVSNEGDLELVGDRIDRAAYHVEELAGILRRLTKLLNHHGVEWKTTRATSFVEEICNEIERSRQLVGAKSSYADGIYKGHVVYDDLLSGLIGAIRKNLTSGN